MRPDSLHRRYTSQKSNYPKKPVFGPSKPDRFSNSCLHTSDAHTLFDLPERRMPHTVQEIDEENVRHSNPGEGLSGISPRAEYFGMAPRPNVISNYPKIHTCQLSEILGSRSGRWPAREYSLSGRRICLPGERTLTGRREGAKTGVTPNRIDEKDNR